MKYKIVREYSANRDTFTYIIYEKDSGFLGGHWQFVGSQETFEDAKSIVNKFLDREAKTANNPEVIMGYYDEKNRP